MLVPFRYLLAPTALLVYAHREKYEQSRKGDVINKGGDVKNSVGEVSESAENRKPVDNCANRVVRHESVALGVASDLIYKSERHHQKNYRYRYYCRRKLIFGQRRDEYSDRYERRADKHYGNKASHYLRGDRTYVGYRIGVALSLYVTHYIKRNKIHA